MTGSRIEEHTADIVVVATGANFDETLVALAKGMFSIMVDSGKSQSEEVVEFFISSIDCKSLVVDRLNELLFRFEVDGFLPTELKVEVDTGRDSLKALCSGERYDPKRHNTLLGVKAATYHELEVSQGVEWMVRVILDI